MPLNLDSIGSLTNRSLIVTNNLTTPICIGDLNVIITSGGSLNLLSYNSKTKKPFKTLSEILASHDLRLLVRLGKITLTTERGELAGFNDSISAIETASDNSAITASELSTRIITYPAAALEFSSSNWTISASADASFDADLGELRAFDSSSNEGVVLQAYPVPSIANDIKFTITMKSSSSGTVRFGIYTKGIRSGSTSISEAGPFGYLEKALTSNQWISTSFSVSLEDIGFQSNDLPLICLFRNSENSNDTLNADCLVKTIEVEYT